MGTGARGIGLAIALAPVLAGCHAIFSFEVPMDGAVEGDQAAVVDTHAHGPDSPGQKSDGTSKPDLGKPIDQGGAGDHGTVQSDAAKDQGQGKQDAGPLADAGKQDTGSAKDKGPSDTSPKQDTGSTGDKGPPDAGPPLDTGNQDTGGNPVCAPMDAIGQGTCKMLLGWKWTGNKCVDITGCSCKGTDCAWLYPTEAICIKANLGC